MIFFTFVLNLKVFINVLQFLYVLFKIVSLFFFSLGLLIFILFVLMTYFCIDEYNTVLVIAVGFVAFSSTQVYNVNIKVVRIVT